MCIRDRGQVVAGGSAAGKGHAVHGAGVIDVGNISALGGTAGNGLDVYKRQAAGRTDKAAVLPQPCLRIVIAAAAALITRTARAPTASISVRCV